ncbi:MAG: DUF115 domain-containing protein [Deltaproteobacteria bacterium]|nr:DUF115 domain-containing protein [Candidatus Zymogenaceae bacterium]
MGSKYKLVILWKYLVREGNRAHTLKKMFLILFRRIIQGKKKPDNRAYLVSLKKFHNLHEGKRCFIIGNGPSLNKTDLSLLKDEYTIGVNGIFYKYDELLFKPTFYVVEDAHVVADNLKRIHAIDYSIKLFPDVYADIIDSTPDTYFFPMDTGFYDPDHPSFEEPRFSKDITKAVYAGQTVTYVNLQIAYYMGFSEVYLIGVDFSYTIPDNAKVDGLTITSQDDDPNHFHPDYFGKGKKWHDPKLYNCIKSYHFAKKVYEGQGRKIYNATIGGNLEVFDRVDYYSLFSKKASPKKLESV